MVGQSRRRRCRIVTRFKSNTRLTVVAENRVSEDGPILSDRIGYLAASRTKSAERKGRAKPSGSSGLTCAACINGRRTDTRSR